MIEKLIKRPIAVTMTIIAIVVLGIVAIKLIPISLMPDLDIPRISIQINAPGYSSKEVDKIVISPIISKLKQVNKLSKVSAESSNGYASILLELEYGADLDYIAIDVNDKIDQISAGLPANVSRPKVIKASATDIPAFFLNITPSDTTSRGFADLSKFVSDVIVRRIEQLPEVALVDVTGLIIPQIIITPDREKLQSLGISESSLIEAINSNNVSLGNLSINDGYYVWDISFFSELKSVKDLEDVYININGVIFQIKQLATVKERDDPNASLVIFNGVKSINLAVIKQSDARMDSLRESVESLMNQFESDYSDLTFHINRDQTLLLSYSISNLRNNIIIGILLASLTIFVFMRDARSPFLVIISIPFSLIVSLLIFYIIGISINIISLSGLILGVGMMVDNSIIVIDNIIQKWERGAGLVNAISQGTMEVVAPMLSSVLTTCSVFLPLIFLSGISGELFYDQAMGVSIGLFSSLFVAIVVIPVYFYQFYKNREWRSLPNKGYYSRVKNLYEKCLIWVFRNQRITWFIAGFLAVTSLLLMNYINKSKLPYLTHDDILLTIDWNEPISVIESRMRVDSFLNLYKDYIEEYNSYVSNQQFVLSHSPSISKSEVLIYLKAKDNRSIRHIESSIKPNLFSISQLASFKISSSQNIFNVIFSENIYDLELAIYRKDGSYVSVDDISIVSQKINDINPNYIYYTLPTVENLDITVKPEMLAVHKVNLSEVHQELSIITKSKELFSINYGTYSIPVIMSQDKDYSRLEDVTVRNRDNVDIPIGLLASIVRVNSFKSVYSAQEGNYYPMFITAKHSDIKKDIPKIESIFKDSNDCGVRMSGGYFNANEMFYELIMVLVISILLLFFILAAQFESMLQPFIILSEIWIDISGALVLLWIFGSSLNVMSMIGVVVMCGIIINDSILKVDTYNRLRREGYSLLRAILEGGSRRFKPIIMTSITTILAISPFLIRGDLGSDLQYPLSISLIGGMIVGTLVSLLFIPLLYYRIYKNSKK